MNAPSNCRLWDVHTGALLCSWTGWGCRLFLQQENRLLMSDALAVRDEAQELSHPLHHCLGPAAIASNGAYVLAALAGADLGLGGDDGDEADGAAGWYVGVWRLVNGGQFVGYLGPHPWEVESLSIIGAAAVSVAFDAAQLWVWDLSQLPGEAVLPSPRRDGDGLAQAAAPSSGAQSLCRRPPS